MWNTVIRNISVVTAVATLVGSAIAFFVQRDADIKQRLLQAQANERESKRVFLNKQADVYFEVVALVSRLANITSPDLIDKADVNRFWQLFWGEFAMVEDRATARAMDLFTVSLNAFQGLTDNKRCAEKRKSIALLASHCIRKSLGDSWGVELEDLDTDTCNNETFDKLERVCPRETKHFRTTQ
jgi:hypothetical protein